MTREEFRDFVHTAIEDSYGCVPIAMADLPGYVADRYIREVEWALKMGFGLARHHLAMGVEDATIRRDR